MNYKLNHKFIKENSAIIQIYFTKPSFLFIILFLSYITNLAIALKILNVEALNNEKTNFK